MVRLVFIVALQTAAPAANDSIYSSPALRRLVERASELNRRVPDSLRTYRAKVESEMAFIARQADGIEQTFTVEQTASNVQWDRSGGYEQRVIGYRSQSLGLTISAAGLFRQAWTVPILYGNRISLLFGQDSMRPRSVRRKRSDIVVAVHPFAADRDEVYHFSGGDTIVIIHPGGRSIPVVRIQVKPQAGRLTRQMTVFDGDIEVDEQRAQIVRMRGRFVTIGPSTKARSRLFASRIEAVAYVELENGEFDQAYWLPTYQRIEAQASIAFLGDQRGIFRVVSHFRGYVVNDVPMVVAQESDSLRTTTHRLTFVPGDSLGRYRAWTRPIGDLSGAVSSDDFNDIAPDVWRPTGSPIVRPRFHEASDLFHYNRIEGAYTGLAAEARLRDAAPGVVVRVTTGWAWSEQTIRGRLFAERQQGKWWPSLRAGRSLDITNDFRDVFDSGSTLGALFSVDDYDYVDRRSAMAGLTRVIGRQRDVRLRFEAGLASDRYVAAQRERGPFARSDSGFRFNRGVDEGRYRIATMKLELHPDINAAFVRPGVGALIQGEAAKGDITWCRVELRLVARRSFGPLLSAVRTDAGVVFGDSIPPQQLFELGENQNLPGYGYKAFAGNEAAVVRSLVMYQIPLWQAPLRFGRLVLPAVAPMISAGAQGGWASATNDAARSAIRRLGSIDTPVLGRPGDFSGALVSRPTDGIRASVDFRIRFFGGAVSAGVARAMDHRERWHFVAGFAQIL
jgi:hypothetical protein